MIIIKASILLSMTPIPLSPISKHEHFQSLDLTDDALLSEFERLFYQAFSQRKNQRLVRQIWSWDDDEKRISLRNPKESIMVHASYNTKGQPEFYIAGVENPRYSQFEQFGFKKPADLGKCLEICTLFSTPHCMHGLSYMNSTLIKEFSLPFLRACGFTSVLATCNDRLLNLYLRWGCKVLDRRSFSGGSTRHFLLYML